MTTTFRTTGLAAIAYAALYVLTFVSNAGIALLRSRSVDYLSPEEMAADLPYAVLGGILLGSLGACLIGVATGLHRIVWSDESHVGVVATILGIIAGAGFVLAGASAAAQRGYAANDLAGTGADMSTQLAVVQGGFLLTNAAFFFVSLAALAWLGCVALAGRRRGTLPRWLIVGTWIAAITPTLTIVLTGFSSGILVTIPYAAALGVWLLRQARRGDESIGAASVVAVG